MSYKDNIRSDIMESLRRYADHGIPTGDFLRACLENNLMESLGRADAYNLRTIHDICMYIHWDIPAPCHGSKGIVEEWLARSKWKKDEVCRAWFNNERGC